MKVIKLLIFLIALGVLARLVYQNQAYFLAATELHLDLWIPGLAWTIPPLPAIAYWGICFGLGLILIGLRGLSTAYRLGREIKAQNELETRLKKEIEDLKTRLDVFIHDPYIKKAVENGKVSKRLSA